MWVFYILLFLPLVIHVMKTRGQEIDTKKTSSTAIGLFFLLLTILIMLRHESVGNDTRNYLNIFARHSRLAWDNLTSDGLEIGYVFYSKLIHSVFGSSRLFIVITSAVVGLMIYPTYKRLNIDFPLTVALFIIMPNFVMMFSGIRQMMAIAIGFLAYEFVRKKKFIPFVIMVAVAMSFHISAFMLVLMYPAYHFRVTKLRLIALIPLLGVLFVFNEPIFVFLSKYIEEYTRFEADVTSTGAYTMLILFTILLIFSFVIPDEKMMDSETLGLRNLLIVSLALQMFVPLHALAMRMNYYYIIFIPLLMPKILQYRKRDLAKVAILSRTIMVIFFIGYFFYSAYTSDNNLNVFPYHFYWESVR